MKARLSLYEPDTLPDITALTARYERLIFMVKVLILSGDYGGVLKTSYDIARAAKALIKGKARAAAIERKLHMLATPKWRARVISDLGGMRKLALWNAAMLRAIERALTPRAPIAKPAPHALAAQVQEDARRAHARKCLKATAHPGIIRDRFRVDFEGQFRLPPLPRAPRAAGKSSAASEYTYDPRKLTYQSGVFAPAAVWPTEFYVAERENFAVTDAPTFTAGKMPASERRPARRNFADLLRDEPGDCAASPAKRRVLAPP